MLRDAPLHIWRGGLEFLLLANFFFTYERKQSFFLAINVRQFFFMFRRRHFLSYAFPIMYVTIWCFVWSTYFSSILPTNFFSAHIFKKLFFSDFCGDKLFFFNFFLAPPQISNSASLNITRPIDKMHLFTQCYVHNEGMWKSVNTFASNKSVFPQSNSTKVGYRIDKLFQDMYTILLILTCCVVVLYLN